MSPGPPETEVWSVWLWFWGYTASSLAQVAAATPSWGGCLWTQAGVIASFTLESLFKTLLCNHEDWK